MPNWAVGSIRLRGKRDDIIRFLRDGLECYGNNVNVEDDGEEVSVSASNGYIHIKNTRRNFILNKSFSAWLVNEPSTMVIENFQSAWSVEAQEFVEIAQVYNLDIRIDASECGTDFEQKIVIENGEIVCDNTFNYDDWMCEARHPNWGG